MLVRIANRMVISKMETDHKEIRVINLVIKVRMVQTVDKMVSKVINLVIKDQTEVLKADSKETSLVINRMVEDLKDLKVISKTDKVVHSLKVSKVDNRDSLVIRMVKVVVHKDSMDKETNSKAKDKVIHKARIKTVSKDSRTNSNKVHKEMFHNLMNIL